MPQYPVEKPHQEEANMLEELPQPRAERPHLPPGYGISDTPPGPTFADWPRVDRQLVDARSYWVCSVGSASRPHAAPVWGVWLDGVLYFSTDRGSRKGRNLAAHPNIAVHLESGEDVVILEGRVQEVLDPARMERIEAVYRAKYDVGLDPGGPAEVVVYALRPRTALTWQEHDFVESPVRWRFPAG
jgi:hypothetical protein